MTSLNELMLQETATKGRWKRYVGDFEVLIASRHTQEYDEAMGKAMEPYLALARDGKFTKEMRTAVSKELASTHVILGWRNLVESPGGPEIPYTPEKALEMLNDPRLFLFWKWVQAESGDLDEYRVKLEADAAKN